MKKFRNIKKVISETIDDIDEFSKLHLMHLRLEKRNEGHLLLDNGSRVVDFINCSYFGLDTDPAIIAGAKKAIDDWGVHFTCARTRLSIQINKDLEEKLSSLFKGRAIVFPSVSSAHASVMPLMAAGEIFKTDKPITLIFDKKAHASMQFLKPILAEEAEIVTIAHNSIVELKAEIQKAKLAGRAAIYVADGLYSMGGALPIDEIIPLLDEEDLYFYIDDAHGTSLFGDRGEGFVMSHFDRIPKNMIVTFSLAKGFGCNGGGVLLPCEKAEKMVRFYGQTYAFSAPLDFSIIGASLASCQYHESGKIRELQKELRRKVALFRSAMKFQEPVPAIFSPIQIIDLPDMDTCKTLATTLLENGLLVSTVFFPVVAKGKAQFRIAITLKHTDDELIRLATLIQRGLTQS